jgi:DNA-binding Lrp family transcriptional regulator
LEQVFADLGTSLRTNLSDENFAKLKLRSAFVFITTENDFAKKAFEDLRQIAGVNALYLSHGAYDIIAKVSAETIDDLREIIFQRIKNLTSIKSTLTLTVI